jgi:tetratricopeptide (TPR) repeat protein
MRNPNSCDKCGGSLVDARCQVCERTKESRFVHREIVVLVVLSAMVVAGFLLTRAAAGANRRLRLGDAVAWYNIGQGHLAGGQTEAAIRSLRRAAAIDRDNRNYRLALAAAFAADRQDEPAKQVLLAVRESTPEDPEVNAQLARLEARHDDATGAVQHYQNALYGSWRIDQGDARRQVRVELIRYLLVHDEHARALSELLVLEANLPHDARLQTEAGQLFLDAGEPRRGLERFRQVLRSDSKNESALTGAGEAAFEIGDYTSAQRFLRAVTSPSSRVLMLRAITDLVLTNDPLRPGLSLRQRQERVMSGFRHALEALDDCVVKQPASDSAFESLRAEASALAPELEAGKLRRKPESIKTALNLIYRIEQQTVDVCGQEAPLDRALLLIVRRHEADRH